MLNVYVVIGRPDDDDSEWFEPVDTLFIENKQVYIWGEIRNGWEGVTLTINQDTVATRLDHSYCIFDKLVDLNEGPNSFKVIATDLAGNADTVDVLIFKPYTFKPHITIDFPPPNFVTDSTSITITGTVSDSSASVLLTINKQYVGLSPSGI